jgi:hypothetical protein
MALWIESLPLYGKLKSMDLYIGKHYTLSINIWYGCGFLVEHTQYCKSDPTTWGWWTEYEAPLHPFSKKYLTKVIKCSVIPIN